MEVVLRNTDGHDGYPQRLLRLTANTTVKVGRSSKTGARNVQPAKDNAFIDSPVISRDHAVLTLKSDDFENPAIFITDTGSMHGTYVDGQKLDANAPFRLQNGSRVQFGAFVYRNSETFPCREYEITIRTPLPSSTGAETPGTFKVPEGESSEEESSYGSSRMDESDIESDCSAPEIHPLRRTGNYGDNHLDHKIVGTRDVVPDSVDQHAEVSLSEEDPTILIAASQSSATPGAKEDCADSLYQEDSRMDTPHKPPQVLTPSPNTESSQYYNEDHHYSPIFGLVPLPQGGAGATEYTEIPDSASIISSEDSDESDEEQPYDLDSLELGSRSMSACSDAESNHINYESEEEAASCSANGEFLEQHSFNHPTEPAADPIEYDPMSPPGVGSYNEQTKDTIKDKQKAEEQSFTAEDVATMPLQSMIQAVNDDVDGKSRLAQSMSLERIMDSPSKDIAAASSSGLPPFARTNLGSRAEAVTVESLLNFSPGSNSAQPPSHRVWKPISGMSQSQTSIAVPFPPKQHAFQDRSGLPWGGSVSFEGFMDESAFLNSQQFSQCRPPSFTANYNNSNIFPDESGMAAFDVPEVEPSAQTRFYAGNDMSGKEPQKAKTSISISDIVDKSPVSSSNGPVTGQKRKAETMDEEQSENGIPPSQHLSYIRNDAKESTPAPNQPAPTPSPSHSTPAEAPARPRKQRKLHPGSTLIGALVGGVGMFAALAFLPDAVFQ